MFINTKKSNKIYFACYEDSENSENKESEGKESEGKEKPVKTFTQEQLDVACANTRKAEQKKNQQLLEKLQGIEKTANMTAAEKEELQAEIKQLQERSMSVEELAKKEKEKIEKQSKEEIEKVSKERDSWKNRFSTSLTQTKIIDAAAKHKACKPSQVLAILSPLTNVEEAKDTQGRPTGEYTPMVRLLGKDKEGKETTLVLTPEQAVKEMKDNTEEYGNLFESESKGGSGGQNTTVRRGKIDQKSLTTKEYIELRKKGEI